MVPSTKLFSKDSRHHLCILGRSVCWIRLHERGNPTERSLVSSVGSRLSALTFSIPIITVYISVKNESSPSIDLLENMDTYIFNEELLLVCLNIDLFQASQILWLHSPWIHHLARDWMQANLRLIYMYVNICIYLIYGIGIELHRLTTTQ